MESLHQLGDILREQYQIVDLLGQGGMGTTYAATDILSQQKIAIKVLSLRQISDWKVMELFEREAKVLANLDHPAIPKYLDYFQIDTESDRRFYLVQQLIEGDSLAALVQKGWHATEAEVKQIAEQILEVLSYLHGLLPPVIHRDLKPQNIIRRPDGQVFLVDFGAVQDVWNTATRSGTFVGTYGYMPPEQFQGQTTCASDLYSLGATLAFLLTHRSPAELPQVRMKIDFRSQLQLSPQFANWLDRLLEPVLEDRCQTAQVALAALRKEGNVESSQRSPLSSIAPQNLLDAAIAKPRKPLDSRVVLEKSSDRLTIDIPPQLKSDTLWGAGFFGGLVYFALFTWILPWFSTGEWWLKILLGVVTSPLFLMAIVAPIMLLFSIFGKVHIAIDRNTFHIKKYFLGIKFTQSQGYVADITAITNKTQESSENGKATNCSIWEGTQEHRLDSELLDQKELDWLVAEISEFVRQQR
ncbi:serine/threonine-protein kinase [Tumidithrix elongata RA019]|uniref:non-specific serine/threonine protein kinase n=1 Tax=Tumidithrix elongata BACA0141 TaxID=2716417 RepID=A0AAW9PSE9_9CYAN|nr:serine/threonine-protein kinase [Tumidithrix elongata RA019]